jgi:hypothetical protein
MFGSSTLLFLVLLAVVAIASYFYLKRRAHHAQQRRSSEIVADPNLLAHWVYAPDDWRKAVEDEFTWVKNKEGTGHIYISPTAICVKNDFQERIVELADKGKVVTNASYRGAEGSLLKLRVRWRVVEQREYGSDEVKYYREDYLIPVPSKYKEEARRVADFFTARIENNMAAYTAVVPDDEPISLFGKDSL